MVVLGVWGVGGWRQVSIQRGRGGAVRRAAVPASCCSEGRCWTGIYGLRARGFWGRNSTAGAMVGGMNLPWDCEGWNWWKIAAASAGIGTGCAMLLDRALHFSRWVGNEAKALPGERNLRELPLCRVCVVVLTGCLYSQGSWQDPTGSGRVNKCQTWMIWSISPGGGAHQGSSNSAHISG